MMRWLMMIDHKSSHLFFIYVEIKLKKLNIPSTFMTCEIWDDHILPSYYLPSHHLTIYHLMISQLLISYPSHNLPSHYLPSHFLIIYRDGSGSVDIEELRAMVGTLGERSDEMVDCEMVNGWFVRDNLSSHPLSHLIFNRSHIGWFSNEKYVQGMRW